MAQTRPAATRPMAAVPPELTGRTVEEVRIIGKNRPLPAVTQAEILRQVRTRESGKFDPDAVAGDYQRIFNLKKFANVEARVEPTEKGVIVIFEVTVQDLIREVRFKGNDNLETKTLLDVTSLRTGEAVDSFRLTLARENIERLYQDKNRPYAHVDIDPEPLKNGIVQFNIVEGPKVYVRKVRILGNRSFTNGKIKGQVKTKAWFPLFGAGRFDPEQLEQDVAAVRQFYENRGFFDVRIGRKVVVSPTQGEVMVDFLIEEGPRYVVDRVTFRGNDSVTEAALREGLNLVEGAPYDQDLVRRDTRQIVRAYSPRGFINNPADPNPPEEYLQIHERRIFKAQPGHLELIYDIHEGRPFRLGRILVKGNTKTQDKVVLREMRVQPGQLYNSAEIQTATDRIRATNLFTAVTITPIGDDPESRDLLVEVAEAQTGRILFGAGVTSNSGVLGSIIYEQRNFDITDWPSSTSEILQGTAFKGAGQTFRLQLEPGTELSRARVDFIEPWLFDQPYSFGASAYLSQRLRSDWTEQRLGGRLSLGKRFNDIWSAKVSVRGEDVAITNIEDEPLRAPEILALEGHSLLTSFGPEIRRDTTDSPILPSKGTITTLGWEHYGALGGDFEFEKVTLGFNWYHSVYQDLLDRKTILSLRTDAGYITGGDDPFFERFYGGGLGSVRGFRYRGISPRAGLGEDPVGGQFQLTGSVELNFPLAGDILRGVIFTDAGTVQSELVVDDIRVAVGFGFRLTLPMLGQLPIALDFGFPIRKDDQDDTRLFSFALGLVQ
jgi:outer membrane protein insertion porin family